LTTSDRRVTAAARALGLVSGQDRRVAADLLAPTPQRPRVPHLLAATSSRAASALVGRALCRHAVIIAKRSQVHVRGGDLTDQQ
jgi:hypothetical protein